MSHQFWCLGDIWRILTVKSKCVMAILATSMAKSGFFSPSIAAKSCFLRTSSSQWWSSVGSSGWGRCHFPPGSMICRSKTAAEGNLMVKITVSSVPFHHLVLRHCNSGKLLASPRRSVQKSRDFCSGSVTMWNISEVSQAFKRLCETRWAVPQVETWSKGLQMVAASAEGLVMLVWWDGFRKATGFHKPMGFHVQAIFGMDRFHGRQRMMVMATGFTTGLSDTLNVGIQVQQWPVDLTSNDVMKYCHSMRIAAEMILDTVSPF